MATGVISWSQTAANNATADTNVNWAEGMAPSAVNNSARAQMASVAMYRDDNAGSLTTGGTSTAFTVTSNQGFGSLSAMDGQSLRVKFNAQNGASATLNVDSLGAKALQLDTTTALPTGMIRANSVVNVVYDNSNSCFIVVGPLSEFASGTIQLFGGASAPTGWTKGSSNNNKALRIVTGTPSTGGSTAFTSVFTSRTIAQGNLPDVNFTVTIPAGQGSHTHSSNATALIGINGQGSQGYSFADATINAATLPAMSGTAASGGSGTALDFAVQYVDYIEATKD